MLKSAAQSRQYTPLKPDQTVLPLKMYELQYDSSLHNLRRSLRSNKKS